MPKNRIFLKKSNKKMYTRNKKITFTDAINECIFQEMKITIN